MRLARPLEGSGAAPRRLRPDSQSKLARLMRVLGSTWLLGTLTVVLLVGVLTGLLVPLDVFVHGLQVWHWAPGHRFRHLMDLLDHIGQRAFCLPLLYAAVALVCWRRRRWWPAIVTTLGVLAVNVIVGAIKLATDRPSPRTGTAYAWQYGDLFPSGHTANIVFVYGLLAWLLIRDTRRGRQYAKWLVLLVGLALALMYWVSTYRATHWFTDLTLGAVLGGLILKYTILLDVRGDRPGEHDALLHPGNWLRRRPSGRSTDGATTTDQPTAGAGR
ncbi:MAG: phosphatase PAP2 family protein [Actinomycetales bacterium]